MPYAALLHSHVSSWAVMIILFFVALVLLNKGSEKGLKITHMILRLFYILVFITGISLLVTLNFPFMYIIKAILVFWMIYCMEMILVRGVKGTLGSRKSFYLFQIVIALVIVLLIGYRMIG